MVETGKTLYVVIMTKKKPFPPGEEERFNEWYNSVHLYDVLKGEGMTRAHRYRSHDDKKYMAIYESEGEVDVDCLHNPERLKGREKRRAEFAKMYGDFFFERVRDIWIHICSITEKEKP